MNQKVNIKRLNITNFNEFQVEISKLLKYSYDISFPGNTLDSIYFERKTQDLNCFLKDESAVAFIAMVNDELAGFIWAYHRKLLTEERIHINHFVVNNMFQGLGIGRNLHDKINEFANEKGINLIDLMVSANSPSVDFYQHLGYEIERLQMKKGVIQSETT